MIEETKPYDFYLDLLELMAHAPDRSIVSRTVQHNHQVKVTLFRFAEGQELSEHTAAFPAIIHILSGQARLSLGSEKMEVGPGAWVYMQPHLKHALFAHTPVVMLLTMIRTSGEGS